MYVLLRILLFGNMFIQILLIVLLGSGADCCAVKNDLLITTPSPMEALSGSCLWIPCTYEVLPQNKEIDTANTVTGIWFKKDPVCGSDSGKEFSISGDPNKSYPMNFTGDLKQKNCTTMFHNLNQTHNDKYYFRVQNGGFKATDIEKFLQITVRDSPWSPDITVSGEQTETKVVTITCSAVTPCPLAPPHLTWDLHQGTALLTETNPDKTEINITKIIQNITVTDAHDGLVIKCKASYPVSGEFKMSDSNVTLSVSYGPKNTSVVVSPVGSLSAGQSVTLSCSSRANPPIHNVTWFRHGSQGAAIVSQGQTYTFNITEEGQYYCVASNTLGNESSPAITLSITEGALLWGTILGAVVGVLMLICLCLFVWCFKKCQGPKDIQEETCIQGVEEHIHYGELDFSKLNLKDASNMNPDGKPQEEIVSSQVKVSQAKPTEEETIHYGELDFSNVNRKHVPGAEPEDTVYSQVQSSKPVDTSGQDKDDSQSVYANVKK